MNKVYMTVQECSDYAGFSKSFFYKLTSKKAIKHLKVGSRCLIKRSDLDLYLDKFKVDAKEADSGR